ncbi:MAG: glycine cleavage system protein H, partial [Gemmatimonadota bacterium]
TVEAVKAVSELYTPISGEVLAVNTSLDEDPAVINRDPFGEGWMIKVKMKDSSELDSLLSADEYKALISES